MDRRADLLIAVLVLVASAAFYVAAAYVYEPTRRDPIGEGGLPQILAIVMALASLVVIVQRLWRWRRELGNVVETEGLEDDPNYPASPVRPMLVWLLAMAYVAVLPIVSFRVATPLLLAGGLLLWDERDWRIIVGVAVLLTAGIWALFEMVLGFILP